MSLIKILRVGAALGGMLLASSAQAEWGWNIPKGATALTHEVWNLHMFVFLICVVIGALVFAVMIWSLIYHRKSRGYEAAQFHESTAVEIAWTVAPFIILVVMAIPAAGTLIKVEDTSNSDLTIKATGYQWLWEYTYVDKDVDFFSRLAAASNEARQLHSGIDPNTVENYLRDVDNPMVVPVGKKVRMLLTSNDVIHAWWVPELSGKKDAIPGYVNEIWFKADKTGTYRGQCAELCGRGHGYMPIVVKVVSQQEFDAWVKQQGGNPEGKATQVADAGDTTGTGGQTATDAGVDTQGAPADSADDTDNATATGDAASGDAAASGDLSKSDLMAQGEKIYNSTCATCHQADGSGLEAAGFPALKGSKVATGPIDAHIQQVLHGKNAMPPFKDSLSDAEIAAVVTYERNAFGNDTGDVVQPAQVKAQR